MANKQITEAALGNALKKLMLTKSINKITVQQITDTCGFTRHTFYNHFADIYELLGWIYENEVIEDFEERCNLKGWKDGLDIVLKYTLDNKTICLNTFHSLGRDHLERFLQTVFFQMLLGAIGDITQSMKVPVSIQEEVASFYTYAVVGQFLQWLGQDLKEAPEEVSARIIRVMDGTIQGLMEKYNEK